MKAGAIAGELIRVGPRYQRPVAGSLAVDVTRSAAQNRRHFAGSHPPLAVFLWCLKGV